MVLDNFIVWCQSCNAQNRILRKRWGDPVKCGRCKYQIHVKGGFPDHTFIVTDHDFTGEVLDFPGPVVTEFFSPT